MTSDRRKLRDEIRRARAFCGEVRRLGPNEGNAILAESLEREDTPSYIRALGLDAFLATEDGEAVRAAAQVRKIRHVHQLTAPQKERLARELRSRCKPVEYETEPRVWPVAA